MISNLVARVSGSIGRCPLLLAVCFAVPTVLAASAAPAESSAERIVALSPYEVTAQTAAFNGWIKARSPHFVLYTDARRKDANTLLRQMEMLHITAQHFLRRTASVQGPSIVILPGARSDWRRLESKGSVEWKPGISMASSNLRHLTVATYDWETEGTYLLWSMQSQIELDWLGIQGAFWFDKGISTFFETAEFKKDSVKIGLLNVRTIFTQTEGWLPWKRFFEITADSPEYTKKTDDRHRVTGQAAGFVQYLLSQPDPVWIGRLLVWNTLLEAGREPDEAIFKEIFQHDWKSWTDLLNKHLNGGRYQVRTFQFPPEVLNLRLEEPVLTPAETRELFVLAQILNQQVPASEMSLDSLLAKDLKTEELRELLVEGCLDWDRTDAALLHLRRLIDAGSKNPSVYATAARLLFKAQVDKPGPDARLTGDIDQIREWCRTALSLAPTHRTANRVLAWSEALAPQVTQDGLAQIGQICKTLDGHSATDEPLLALAVARWRAGNASGAQAVCEMLLKSPFAHVDKKSQARELLARLQSPAAPSPAAARASGP